MTTGNGKKMRSRLKFAWYAIPAVLLTLAFVPYQFDHGSIKQNDAAAIGRLRVLMDAQTAHSAQHPEEGFACLLADLSQPSEYSGYRFVLTCPAVNGTVKHYEAFGEPAQPLKTGLHAYCMTEAGVIWWDERGSGVNCLRAQRPFDFRFR